ncbi:uncharacterized protein LOC122512301 isoform X1 [Leptopilina heterotoma]|uniref:uncharacterized protein LOC122512301 isoform X1 n=1 Tax=Leptopilina heterotoma TaxID=63436 RepID=UPI001CA97031|nr:uncharacterized protein LOC122512301 isoform X1 [Leptopilina heterotoma]
MFSCHSCDLSFKYIREYNKHQRKHAFDANLEILCAYSGCTKKFNTYGSFNVHIFRNHRYISQNVQYSCKQRMCNFQCNDLKILKNHLYAHFKKSNTGVFCSIPNCPIANKKFLSSNSLRIHISRIHRNCDDLIVTNLNSNLCNTESNIALENSILQSPNENDSNIVLNNPPQLKNDNYPTYSQNNIDFDSNNSASVKRFAQLYLDLSVNHNATEAVLQPLIEGIFSEIERSSNNFLNSNFNSDLSDNDKEKVANIFNNSFSPIFEAHSTTTGLLRTTFCRNKYYDKNFKYVEPVQLSFPVSENEKECYYQYVPILSTIKLLLENKDVLNHVLHPQLNEQEGFFDFTDGNATKNNDFFMHNVNNLKILLYQDAFEICNPIGSSRGKNKVVGVYMILGNLPPYLRSKTNNVRLVLLCLEKDLKRFGWDIFFKQLIEDLKMLETVGVKMLVGDQEMLFKGTIAFVYGDNLGSNGLGEFTENFSKSNYFCRFCEIDRSQFSKNQWSNIPFRTPDNYDKCASEAIKTNSMVKGIKKNSCLNKLNNFHVCRPGLPPCLAHDLFEGIIPRDLMYIIKYFLKKKWFRIHFLNCRLRNIRLSTDNSSTKSVLPVIKKNYPKLCGTASEIKRLILILPLAIFDKIKNEADQVWQMVLSLREVCTLICAPALSSGQITLINSKIEDYLSLRLACFPRIKLQPKHHIVSHYPDLTLEFGPLKHVQTLRLESVHQVFKNSARHCRNFRNVTKTLATKRQKMQGLNNDFSNAVISYNCSPYVAENHYVNINVLIQNTFSKDSIEGLKFSSEVDYRGIKYLRNMSVCVGKSTFGNFVICRIEIIVINSDNSNIYFIGRIKEIIPNTKLGVYETLSYNETLSCDETSQDPLKIFPFSSLLSPDPIGEIVLSSSLYYLPKYSPFDPDL